MRSSPGGPSPSSRASRSRRPRRRSCGRCASHRRQRFGTNRLYRVPPRKTAAAAFAAALDALVPQLQQDRSILAAILGGSLSHDKVWAKSDIDLLLVTTDDALTGPPHVSLYADGLNVHAMLMQ